MRSITTPCAGEGTQGMERGSRPRLQHALSLDAVSDVSAPPRPHCGRLCLDRQGHSVFEFNTDESQCLCRLGSQPAASRRSVGFARPP